MKPKSNTDSLNQARSTGLFNTDRPTELTNEDIFEAERLAQLAADADKTQITAEKLKLREEYQNLVDQLEDQAKRITEGNTSECDLQARDLISKLNEVDNAFGKRPCGKELAADAHLLESFSKLTFTQILAQVQDHKARTVNPKSFGRKLTLFLSENSSNINEEVTNPNVSLSQWCCFGGCSTSKVLNRPPPLNYIRPLMSNSEPIVKLRKQRAKGEEKKEDRIMLKGLTATEIHGDAGSLAKELDNVRNCLKKQMKRLKSDRLGYFEFVLHPTDFARSVENIFYVSFLVKEGKIGLVVGENGLPEIVKISEDATAEAANGSTSHQAIVSISIPIWREIVKSLNITESAIG